MKVKFGRLEESIDELEKDAAGGADRIRRCIVRATNLIAHTLASPLTNPAFMPVDIPMSCKTWFLEEPFVLVC